MFKSITKSRLVMATGTLGCALGIGALMQMSGQAAEPSEVALLDASSVNVAPLAETHTEQAQTAESGETETQISVTPDAPQVIQATATADSLPEPEPASLAMAHASEATTPGQSGELTVEKITLTRAEPVPPAAAPQPANLPATPVAIELAALSDAPAADLPTEEVAPAFGCDITMAAQPVEAALVQLDLSAPCMAGERFTLHHNGMMITAVTDDAGDWTAEIPALSRNALFIAAFLNGEGAVANAEVPELSNFDRYVIQWKGFSGMQIHALEYGADYGQDGHVWHDTAREPAVGASGKGGFLVTLGDNTVEDALLAEVYSFPSAIAQDDGDVAISLEVEITGTNCGRDIIAQALIKTSEGLIGARDLELAIPDCNAVGDFLVLKNLYEDLKIARN